MAEIFDTEPLIKLTCADWQGYILAVEAVKPPGDFSPAVDAVENLSLEEDVFLAS